MIASDVPSAAAMTSAASSAVAPPVSASSTARRERRSASSAVPGPAIAPGSTRAITASVTALVPPAS